MNFCPGEFVELNLIVEKNGKGKTKKNNGEYCGKQVSFKI